MSEREDMRDEPVESWLADALKTLPRERDAGTLLEERTVRALRERGLVAGGAARRTWSWVAAGAAASIALFACGVATGQWLGAQQTTRALALQQQASMEEMAALVERTGGAYVDVLARLAETPEGATDSEPAREAARQILHQAANEMVRMAPNDPVSVKILQGLDHAALQTPAADAPERRRQIMWF
jgi:hypothetical protein